MAAEATLSTTVLGLVSGQEMHSFAAHVEVGLGCDIACKNSRSCRFSMFACAGLL